MSWWNAVTDFASDAWDIVKSNPLTAAGTVIGAAKDGWGGAAKGAIVGSAADAFFSPDSYSSKFFGTNGNQGQFSQLFGRTDPGSAMPSNNPGAALATQNAVSTGVMAPNVGISPATTSVAAPSSAASGMFGGAGVAMDADEPWRARSDMFLGGAGGGGAGATATGGFSGALSKVRDFGTQNPELTQLGIQGLSYLAGSGDRNAARDMARKAQLRADEMYDYNRSVADKKNADADAVMNNALSTSNPYQTATRSYAQAQMSGQRAVDDLDRLTSRGLSPNTIAAEKRRAKLNTSLGATTAYTQGFDAGAKEQRAGLQTASGMRTGLTGGTGYNDSVAQALKKQADTDSSQVAALLESYTGNPSRRLRQRDANAQGETERAFG